MKDLVIENILIPSIHKLYEIDFNNILIGVSERNICARLAHHMENLMREASNRIHFQDYFADVEYNRLNNGSHKYYENNEGHRQYMVSDLLIHSRNEIRNLLAIEMKRKGNNNNVEKDKERLISLVSPFSENSSLGCIHNTLIGAFITYSSDDVIVELFENVCGIGEKTDEIRFDCKKDGTQFLSLNKL